VRVEWLGDSFGSRSSDAPMRLVAEYLKHAEFCRTLADMAQPQDKKILEELADKWERVAALREQDLIEAKDSTRA
jgi:hypothetical protein